MRIQATVPKKTRSKRTLVITAIVVVLILLIGLYAAARSTRTDSDEGDVSPVSGNDPVTVLDGDQRPQEFESYDEAAAYVSNKTGLTDFVPETLPPDFRVTELAISATPPGAPSSLLRVTSNIRRGSSAFTLIAVDRSFRSPVITEENLIAESANGASLYRVERDGIAEYTLATEERGWIATIPNDLGIDQAAAQDMMLSLVE